MPLNDHESGAASRSPVDGIVMDRFQMPVCTDAGELGSVNLSRTLSGSTLVAERDGRAASVGHTYMLLVLRGIKVDDLTIVA